MQLSVGDLVKVVPLIGTLELVRSSNTTSKNIDDTKTVGLFKETDVGVVVAVAYADSRLALVLVPSAVGWASCAFLKRVLGNLRFI